MSIEPSAQMIIEPPQQDEGLDIATDWSERPGPNSQLMTRLQGDKANVVLIDDRTLFGECLVACLRAADPSSRFSLYPVLEDWLADYAGERNTILLLCINAETSDAAATLKRVHALDPSARFIIVSSQEGYTEVHKALEMGAGGYILTSMNLRVLIQVIHLVQAGGTFVPASVVKNYPTLNGPQPVNPQNDLNSLSPRQLLVAKALRKGTPNKIIAYELNMCESTVKVHVRHIMKKLNAKNRTQIAFLTNSLFSKDDH